jgi:SNF family Na+-dependent transporter
VQSDQRHQRGQCEEDQHAVRALYADGEHFFFLEVSRGVIIVYCSEIGYDKKLTTNHVVVITCQLEESIMFDCALTVL